MSVLLRFADGELADAAVAEVFADGVVDFRRVDEVVVRDVEVAVVFHHAGVEDLRVRNAFELVELGIIERFADFDRAVAAEVEVNDDVAVLDCPDGRLAVVGDDERRKILVDGLGLCAERFDRFLSGLEEASFSRDVSFPALADHVPVCAVAVHGDVHASAAGSDAVVKPLGVETFEVFFKGENVVERGGLGNVASVEKDVEADGFDAFLFRFFDHAFEVVDMAVDIAVGEEADEVHGSAFLGFFHGFFPGFAFKHFS